MMLDAGADEIAVLRQAYRLQDTEQDHFLVDGFGVAESRGVEACGYQERVVWYALDLVLESVIGQDQDLIEAHAVHKTYET